MNTTSHNSNDKKPRKKSLKKPDKKEEENAKETAEHEDKKPMNKRISNEKPKKPLSAFFLFCADKRAEAGDKKYSPIELGSLYKCLPDSEKEKYELKCQQLKKQYEKDLADYFNKGKSNSDEESKDTKKK